MNSILNFLVFGGATAMIYLIVTRAAASLCYFYTKRPMDQRAINITKWYSIVVLLFVGTLAAINQYHHFV